MNSLFRSKKRKEMKNKPQEGQRGGGSNTSLEVGSSTDFLQNKTPFKKANSDVKIMKKKLNPKANTMRVSKPEFVRIDRFKCYDIEETDEPECSFISSGCETPEVPMRNGYSTTPAPVVKKSGFNTEARDTKRHRKAESSIKNCVLDCFTIKAQSMLYEMRKERRKKYSSCSTSRNSMTKMKFNTLKSVLSNESSPIGRISCDGLSTPSEILSFNPVKEKEINFSTQKNRRTRKTRMANQLNKQKTFNNQVKKSNKLRKSIEGVSVYKGPISKGYPISSSISSLKGNLGRNHINLSSFEYRIPTSTKVHHLDLSKDSMAFKKAKEWTSEKEKLVPSSTFQTDKVSLSGRFSNSTRSSLVRNRRISNSKSNYCTVDPFKLSKNTLARSSRNLASAQASSMSLSTVSEMKRKAKPKKMNKLVLNTKINLSKEDSIEEAKKPKKLSQYKAKAKASKRKKPSSKLFVMLL